MFSTSLKVLLAVSAVNIHAIRFDGPPPTQLPKPDLINGRSPRPTADPNPIPHIFRRQDEIDEGLCGYIDGNPSSSVSCSVGNCMYDTDLNWFGCCTGGSAKSDCSIVTKCVASASIPACLKDPSCYDDDYAIACNAAESPYCGEMSSSASGGMITHYVCVPTATQVELLPTDAASGSAEGNASSRVSSARVTALSNSASSTRSTSSRRLSTSDEEETTSATSRAIASTRIEPTSATQDEATSSQSTGAAVKTAQAVAGAGGIVGLLALFL